MQTGTADLPLHSGHAPRWLFSRMERLAGQILAIMAEEHGTTCVLQRLADPYWFQSFGCVLGFDWHSSGVTTTTCGAIKAAVKTTDIGIQVAGGKGKNSAKAPTEILTSEYNLTENALQRLERASKLSAKVDNSCVQDSYRLYHHNLFYIETGDWCVIQQGLHHGNNYARRYHWISHTLDDFFQEPHAGIIGENAATVMDLTARESTETRKAMTDLVQDNPVHLLGEQQTLDAFTTRHRHKRLHMPAHHPVLQKHLGPTSMQFFKQVYEYQPTDFEELVLFRGMGPQKMRSLSLIAQLIYGTEASWRDPAKFSFAHGGKDGHPYPVNRQRYDANIQTLQEAIEGAEISQKEKRRLLRRLAQLG